MEKRLKINKILLAGGGTAGSVSPLLAIFEDLKTSLNFEFLFVGTKKGIEKQMSKDAAIPYRAIMAGKLRRYFDWHNFFDIIKIKIAFWQSFFLILKFKPDLIISAGSFVAVPVVWAGWLLRVPIIVHQMDIRPGLANKLMAPFAKVITTTFEKSLTDYGKKAVWTGNPIGQKFSIFNFQFSIKEKFNLKDNLPVVFVYGGGTGAEAINKLVEASLDNLIAFCQIIHSTGKGKMIAKRHENYHPYEFLNAEEMASALHVADVIVSRAGLGAFTEISAAAKPAIIIPMPDSHQEDNAALLVEKKAAVVLNQKTLTADEFVVNIRELLKNEELKSKLSLNVNGLMKDGANEEIEKIIVKLLHC
jgi:UDP-N-acetylglucosamine--N-acetylmuramyl-(pentapeptide) pyrophosphoryl-undecaprenol N-acetylglucosamine transferase